MDFARRACLLLAVPSALRAADLTVEQLRVEYTPTPLGIDVAAPRFSWQLVAGPRGRIESGWEQGGTTRRYRFVVPANTSATVYLPARQERDVLEGGQRAAKAPGIRFLRLENGRAVYEIDAGRYEFTATQK